MGLVLVAQGALARVLSILKVYFLKHAYTESMQSVLLFALTLSLSLYIAVQLHTGWPKKKYSSLIQYNLKSKRVLTLKQ
jgi:hypothetical protein